MKRLGNLGLVVVVDHTLRPGVKKDPQDRPRRCWFRVQPKAVAPDGVVCRTARAANSPHGLKVNRAQNISIEFYKTHLPKPRRQLILRDPSRNAGFQDILQNPRLADNRALSL